MLKMYSDGLTFTQHVETPRHHVRTCDQRGDKDVTDVHRWINVHIACTDTSPTRTCEVREDNDVKDVLKWINVHTSCVHRHLTRLYLR